MKNVFFKQISSTSPLSTSSLAALLLCLVASTPAHADDPVASKICIQNHGGFVMKGSIAWNGGNTPEQGNYPNPDTKCFDLMDSFKAGKIKDGTSTWAVANILAGPNNKESSENVTFSSTSNSTVTYTITGTTSKSSFHRQ